MRWLVTGGAGFIGSHLVDALLEDDLGEVVVFDHMSPRKADNIARHLGDPRFELIEGDVRNADAIVAALAGIDHVVHLAACSSVMAAEADYDLTLPTNVRGTLNVLQGALSVGAKRVVFSSSREVYGDPAYLPVGETAPLAPKNLYGASKVAGEAYCSVFNQRGLDVRVLRLSNIYGPRDSGRVVPRWLANGLVGKPLTVFGGNQVLDLLWVDYAVDAILASASVGSFRGPINVSSGIGIPIRALAARIIELTGGRSEVEVLPARSEEVIGFVGLADEMRRQLGIEPPVDPLSGLRLMLDAGVVAGLG